MAIYTNSNRSSSARKQRWQAALAILLIVVSFMSATPVAAQTAQAEQEGPLPWEDLFIFSAAVDAKITDIETWWLKDESARFSINAMRDAEAYGSPVYTGRETDVFPSRPWDHINQYLENDRGQADQWPYYSYQYISMLAGRNPESRVSGWSPAPSFVSQCVGDEVWISGTFEPTIIAPGQYVIDVSLVLFELDDGFEAITGRDACDDLRIWATEFGGPGSYPDRDLPAGFGASVDHETIYQQIFVNIETPEQPLTANSSRVQRSYEMVISGAARATIDLEFGFVRLWNPDTSNQSVAASEVIEQTVEIPGAASEEEALANEEEVSEEFENPYVCESCSIVDAFVPSLPQLPDELVEQFVGQPEEDEECGLSDLLTSAEAGLSPDLALVDVCENVCEQVDAVPSHDVPAGAEVRLPCHGYSVSELELGEALIAPPLLVPSQFELAPLNFDLEAVFPVN